MPFASDQRELLRLDLQHLLGVIATNHGQDEDAQNDLDLVRRHLQLLQDAQ